MGAGERHDVVVADGEVPVWVTGPSDDAVTASLPGVVVVPSIFGVHDDLQAQMASLADVGSAVLLDPFWRLGGGTIPYDRHEAAIARLADFDRGRCRDDIRAVVEWATARTNGELVGLGICFGGPWALVGAARGWFVRGAVAWHGSGLENVLDRLDGLSAPVRLHYGDADPITPPASIDAVRRRFADHGDCRIVVHPGADHGFSHEGDAWDPVAAAAGLDSVRELLVGGAAVDTVSAGPSHGS